jgi:hypothetical protein
MKGKREGRKKAGMDFTGSGIIFAIPSKRLI